MVKQAARWPAFLVGGLLTVLVTVFSLFFISASTPVQDQPAATLTADTYMNTVRPLLANADPQNGEVLLVKHDCAACHRAGAVNKIAPSFVGIAERAANRRPPLTAAAYIYESILHPTAYLVEGFVGAMPQNFSERLSDNELGDIIAYLLTPDAQ